MNLRYLFLLTLSFLLFGCSSSESNDKKNRKEDNFIVADGKLKAVSDFIDDQSTIFYLIRHAEKGEGEDPDLTTEGKARAERLAKILESAQLSTVFSTNTKRTINTVVPTATLKDKAVKSYNASQQDALFNSLISRKGEQFLVVGHSNTIPGLLNLFQKKKVYKEVNENQFDDIYVVIAVEDEDAEILEFKY